MRTKFLLLVLILAAAASRSSAITYHLTDLGIPNGQQIIAPAALNNQGQVAASTEYFAFRFSNGAWQNLGVLAGGTTSSAAAINRLGQVVGSSQFQNGGAIRHATLYDNGAVTDLGTLSTYGEYSFGRGINASGQVVGSVSISASSSTTHGFIWAASNGIRELDPRAGGATSINDAGMVTGTWRAPNTASAKHAYIWEQAAGVRDIGTLVPPPSDGNPYNQTFSSGAFINNNGHVVGSSSINNFDNRNHAFLYDGTTIKDLGSLGPNDFYSDRSSASSVNSYDEVVGGTYRPYTGGALYAVAFVYRNGTMFDLETLVDSSGSDYRLSSAVSINDRGEILVDAIKVSTNERRAVLLVPNSVAASFTNLMDSTGGAHTGFGPWPSINNNGDVAFYAEGGTSPTGAYKRSSIGTVVFVADANNGAPSINDLGELTSRRLTSGVTEEIYKGTGPLPAVVAQAQSSGPTGSFRLFSGYPYLADSTGIEVFYAEMNPLNPRRRGIYSSPGSGTASLVVDNTSVLSYFGDNPSVNNAGSVAFIGTLTTTESGLFVGKVGGNNAATKLITDQTSNLLKFESSPSINNRRQIAFEAYRKDTGMPVIYEINEDGTRAHKLADAAESYFSDFRAPMMNDVGTVAFIGYVKNGTRGIFIGGAALADKVIAEGDPLFGSTVTSVSFFHGLNDRNQIAFYYSLADGRSGIARADLNLPGTPTQVGSRTSHGDAGLFDINLPTTGTPGIEPRAVANGEYHVAITFPEAVTFSDVAVAAGPGGSASLFGPPAMTTDFKQIIVNLTGVT
ncbi:MAG: DUF3466 family protein, partial [Verrucomicrobiota bacterium]|nr:DUF3466 family protein [Verrucomicrobiota bacterium]